MHDVHYPKNEEQARGGEVKKEREVNSEGLASFFAALRPRAPRPSSSRNFIFNFLILASIAILVGSGLWFLKLRDTESRLARAIAEGSARLGVSVSELGKLEPQRAADELRSVSPDVGQAFGTFTRVFLPFLKSSFGAYQSLEALLGHTLELTEEVALLEANALKLMIGQRGREVVSHLNQVSALLAAISEENTALASSTSRLKDFSPAHASFYLPLQVTVQRFREFLDTFIPWLGDSNPHHVLVLLGNTSELRPAGGFIGSYLDVTLREGDIQNVSVHDINDADRELETTIVPPKPLQAIVTRWRAADANWFFHIPDSAGKVVELIEASRLYRDQSITFDGALLVTPRVVADLLSLTGPLTLPETKAVIDETTFLKEIQGEVERSRSVGESYPKKILTELVPLILQELARFGEEKNNLIIKHAIEWVKNKDLVLYFKEPRFQEFFSFYDMTGELYELPANQNVSYLGVAVANMASGKTDLFMKQHLTFHSQFSDNGTVSSQLILTREHLGTKAKERWYRTTNESYIKVLTSPTAYLVGVSGAFEKKITPRIDYLKSGYSVDTLLASVESTWEESPSYPAVTTFVEAGKKVFGLWSRVGLGEAKKITLDYIHRVPFLPVDGGIYEFVFDKQVGASSTYTFELSAPVGFVWQENNLPVYEYTTSNLPSRLTLRLTLRKI